MNAAKHWQPIGLGTALRHGWASFYGLAGDNRLHSHHALQIAVGSSAPVTVHTPRGSISGPGVLIPSDAPHRLLPTSEPVHLLYVDPQHWLGQRLVTRSVSGAQLLTAEVAQRVAIAIVAQADQLLDGAASALGFSNAHSVGHGDLSSTLIERVDRHLQGAISTAQLAQEFGYSASHFSRIFRRNMGLPVRAYVRWRRLLLAIRAIAQGANLTRAAADAGFADSAHLSRCVRQNFGIEARVLLGLGMYSDPE